MLPVRTKWVTEESIEPIVNVTKLSAVGLVLLGVLAAALSVAAVFQHRGAATEPEAVPAQTSSPSSEPPSATPAEPTDPAASPTATPSEPDGSSDGPVVVILGDSYSVGEPDASWVGAAAAGLGWGEVVNLSAPGRGYLQSPRSCDFEVCANFRGSIPAVLEHDPNIVITFGGTADGDYSLAGPADEYFAALRDALPDAELVAISPVTGDDAAPYWLTLHKRTIGAAVEAADGTMVDAGQPGIGDGETLSAETHAEIAQAVIDQLSTE